MASMTEKVMDYMDKTNLKSFLEWITAECIYNRPDDPVQFCQDLMKEKIESRGNKGYEKADGDEYLTTFYSKTIEEESADCHERHEEIPSLNELMNKRKDDQMMKNVKCYENILQCAEDLGASILQDVSKTEKVLLSLIATHLAPEYVYLSICFESLTNLEEADEVSPVQIIPEPLDNTRDLISPENDTICINDAEDSPQYDSSMDEKKGYTTKNILVGTLYGREKAQIGVIQLENKPRGFDEQDVFLFKYICKMAGLSLVHSYTYENVIDFGTRLESLVDMSKTLQHEELGVNHLIFAITRDAPKIVNADTCTLFMVDKKDECLWAMQGGINQKVPMNKGIIGAVVNSLKPLNIADAYEDERFNRSIDAETGYRTKSILCVPIIHEETLIAVIELVNKKNGVFGESDVDLMTFFTSYASRFLYESHLFNATVRDGNEFSGSPLMRRSSSHTHSHSDLQAVIGEEEEEDEEVEDVKPFDGSLKGATSKLGIPEDN